MKTKNNHITLALLFLYCIILLFIGCSWPINDSDETNTEEDDNGAAERKFTDLELFERNIFLCKRRTRKIGFNEINGQYDYNDFDRDGIQNSEDPFPLDYSYPGFKIQNIQLPIITEQGKNNTFNYTSITGNTTPTVSTFRFNLANFANDSIFKKFDEFSQFYSYSENGIIDSDVSGNNDNYDYKLNVVSINNKFTDGTSFDREYHQDKNFPNIHENTIWALSRLTELGKIESPLDAE